MKKYNSFLFIPIILIVLFRNINSQVTTTLTAASLEYDGILGVGWGVFACILAIIVGIICCIYGLATIFPGVFLAIGFCVPITTVIFMAFVPLEQPGNLNEKDNPTTNSYVVVRWLYLTIMLIGILLLLIPLCKLWNIMLIPQRVDSRAQREYQNRIQKLAEFEKKYPPNNDQEVIVPQDNQNVIIPIEKKDQQNIRSELPKRTQSLSMAERKQRLLGLRRAPQSYVPDDQVNIVEKLD